jgi:hypothetical protein
VQVVQIDMRRQIHGQTSDHGFDEMQVAEHQGIFRIFTRSGAVIFLPKVSGVHGRGLAGSCGRSNKQIGEHLFISAKTVSVHVSNILAKLGAAGRTEAAAEARRRGLLTDI